MPLHACTHARTDARGRYIHAGMRVPAAAGAAVARTWMLRARRFIIARTPGASVARHARARACVSESGARRRTDHPRVCLNAARIRIGDPETTSLVCL